MAQQVNSDIHGRRRRFQADDVIENHSIGIGIETDPNCQFEPTAFNARYRPLSAGVVSASLELRLDTVLRSTIA